MSALLSPGSGAILVDCFQGPVVLLGGLAVADSPPIPEMGVRPPWSQVEFVCRTTPIVLGFGSIAEACAERNPTPVPTC